MALWQFTIELIPQRWLDAGGQVPALFVAESYDVGVTWLSHRDAALEQRFGSVLPLSKSWIADLTCWGSEQANEIQIWRTRGHVKSVKIRFDLRHPNIGLISTVLDIAQASKLAILVPDIRRVVECDVKGLLRIAGESDAAHYVLDPQSFLMELDVESAHTH